MPPSSAGSIPVLDHGRWISRKRNGRIVEHTADWDAMGMMQQPGVIEVWPGVEAARQRIRELEAAVAAP